MTFPVDYSLFASAAPTFPLWFLIPFFIYILSMPIAGMALAERHGVRDEPNWMLILVGFGIFAQMTFLPWGIIVWLVVLMFVCNFVDAYAWQTLMLHALLLGTFGGSCHLWARRSVRC